MLSLPQNLKKSAKASAAPKKTITKPSAEESHPMTSSPAPASIRKPKQVQPQTKETTAKPTTEVKELKKTEPKPSVKDDEKASKKATPVYGDMSSTPSLDLSKESKFRKQEEMDPEAL